MSKKEKERKNLNFSKTGYSNSRLSGQTLGKSQPELSFDAMTIVGNLNKTNAKKLSDFMSVEPQIRLWDILQTKFKAKALQEKVYIEYDKVKADTWDRRNMRVEFNPNKLTSEEMLWLKQNIIDYMEDDGFTRLDLAFDFEDDLSDYYAMTDKAVKKTVFYGRNGKPETKYFGVRDSDRFIRIYNKKQERKDNADVEVMSEHLWRVEVELKRDMVDYWNDCFNDLHILKPAWITLEKINEQAMVYTLLHEESMWGKLSKNTKTKFKKLIKIESAELGVTNSELVNSIIKKVKPNTLEIKFYKNKSKLDYDNVQSSYVIEASNKKKIDKIVNDHDLKKSQVMNLILSNYFNEPL